MANERQSSLAILLIENKVPFNINMSEAVAQFSLIKASKVRLWYLTYVSLSLVFCV